MRVFCWQHHYGASMDALNHLTPALRLHGRVTGSDLGEPLASVCKRADRLAESVTVHYEDLIHNEAAEQRIAEIRSVVSAQFRGLGDMLREMADSFRQQTVCDEAASRRICEYLTEAGLTPVGVTCCGDAAGRISVELCAKRGRTALNPEAVRQAVSRICGRRFGVPGVTHSGGQVRMVLSEQPMYRAETGVAQHICCGAQLCGDHYEFFLDGNGHAVMALSDGMGSGGRAAVDSAMACGILSRLLLSGLGYDCALRMINSALYVKSGDESLATVDVAEIDLVTGRAVFRKAGAAVGYVRCGNRLRQMGFQIGAHLIGRSVFVRHMTRQKIDQLREVGVRELAVGVAPFAVRFVERPVRFAADGGIVREGHSAALADQLARCAKQGVDRHVEPPGQQFQGFGVGDRLTCFPARHGLAGNIDLRRQFLLRQAVLRAQTQ